MIRPLGHRILIKVEPIEDVSKGGIILTSSVKEQDRLAKEEGVVVALGSAAYKELGDGTPWMKVGDKVYFQRYGGIMIKEKEGDKEVDYRIINDEDVLAIKN